MSDNPHVQTETRGRVGLVTLNKPEKLNAWDRPMRNAILAALRRYDADPGIGAVVITGTGERAFCAGQDFAEAHDFDEDGAEAWIREWEDMYATLRGLSKPIVAALNGTAAGSAFQVVLLCDLRVAHDEVKLGQPEINTGIASITGPWIMKEALGMARTVELTLTGRLMGAAEAQQAGLVQHLVPRAQVLPKALEVAGQLADKAPVAMRLDRRWLRDINEASFRAMIEYAIRAHRESYRSGEPVRRMEAFMAKHGGQEGA
jgi:enoyl-CoA hydratase/carnithine racemase